MTGKIFFQWRAASMGLIWVYMGTKKLIFKKIRHFEFRHLEKLRKVGVVLSRPPISSFWRGKILVFNLNPRHFIKNPRQNKKVEFSLHCYLENPRRFWKILVFSGSSPRQNWKQFERPSFERNDIMTKWQMY